MANRHPRIKKRRRKTTSTTGETKGIVAIKPSKWVRRAYQRGGGHLSEEALKKN